MTGLTRRNFLNLSASAVGASLITGPVLAAIVKPLFIYEHDFKGAEAALIDKAMRIVERLLTNPNLLKNYILRMVNTSNGNHYYDYQTWLRSNLGHPSGRDWRFVERKHLLQFQIKCLQWAKSHGDSLFVDIASYWSDMNELGNGDIGTVACISEGFRYELRGHFRVNINKRRLKSRYIDTTDPEADWAKVIVHEMLHNLGHLHPEGDYTDKWQINLFHNVFRSQGTYSGGAGYVVYKSGGGSNRLPAMCSS